MNTDEKIEKIEEELAANKKIADSLKENLKEAKKQRPYGTTRGLWLSSMKAITGPFAAYNESIHEYLKDPELHQFRKLVTKTQNLIAKITKRKNSFNNHRKVLLYLEKLVASEAKMLLHPVYTAKKYDDAMNVEETLNELQVVKNFLCKLEQMFKVHLPIEGATEEQQAELLKLMEAKLSGS